MLRVGRLEMDLLTRTVSHAGKPVELLPREYCLLECLMRHAGQVVTPIMRFEDVWNYHHIEPTNVIDVHIGNLRRKTDPDEASSMIQTGPGRLAHVSQRRWQGNRGLGQRPWHPCSSAIQTGR
jgi:two-component system OmpR family response regulator